MVGEFGSFESGHTFNIFFVSIFIKSTWPTAVDNIMETAHMVPY